MDGIHGLVTAVMLKEGIVRINSVAFICPADLSPYFLIAISPSPCKIVRSTEYALHLPSTIGRSPKQNPYPR